MIAFNSVISGRGEMRMLQTDEAERQEAPEAEPERRLGSSVWILCALLPPVGLFLLWKRWSSCLPGQRSGAAAIGVAALVICPCIGFALANVALLAYDEYVDGRDKARQLNAVTGLHAELLPRFEKALEGASEAFSTGDMSGAEKAFFIAEQIASEMDDRSVEDAVLAYSSNGWQERHAAAVLGRAAVALEGNDQDGARALIERALGLFSEARFPVPTSKGEAFCRTVRIDLESDELSDAYDRIAQIVESYRVKLSSHAIRLPKTDGGTLLMAKLLSARIGRSGQASDSEYYVEYITTADYGDHVGVQSRTYYVVFHFQGALWSIQEKGMIDAAGRRAPYDPPTDDRWLPNI